MDLKTRSQQCFPWYFLPRYIRRTPVDFHFITKHFSQWARWVLTTPERMLSLYNARCNHSNLTGKGNNAQRLAQCFLRGPSPGIIAFSPIFPQSRRPEKLPRGSHPARGPWCDDPWFRSKIFSNCANMRTWPSKETLMDNILFIKDVQALTQLTISGLSIVWSRVSESRRNHLL